MLCSFSNEVDISSIGQLLECVVLASNYPMNSSIHGSANREWTFCSECMLLTLKSIVKL
jgi:hypothetical protein